MRVTHSGTLALSAGLCVLGTLCLLWTVTEVRTMRVRRKGGRPPRHRQLPGGPATPSDEARIRWRSLPRLVAAAVALLFRSSRWLTVVMFLLHTIVSGGQAVVLISVGRVVEAGSRTPGQFAPAALAPSLSLLGGTLLVVAVSQYLQSGLLMLLTERVTWRTWEELLDVATTADPARFDDPAFHDRLSRARAAGNQPLAITSSLLGLGGSITGLLGLGGVLASLHPALAVMLTVLVFPLVFANSRFSRHLYQVTAAFSEEQRRRGYLSTLMVEREPAMEVWALGLSGYLRAKSETLFRARNQALQRALRRAVPRFLFGGVAAASALTLGVGTVATLAMLGKVSVAGATVATLAVTQYGGMLSGLATSTNNLYQSALFLSDFREFQAMKTSLRRRPRHGVTLPAPRDFRTISVTDVTFAYPGSRRPAVQGVSMALHAGQVVALVGENGSGKTTLAKLLCNFYQPSSGSIRWDGIDTADVDAEQLRESVAVLFQHFGRYLFTVAESIGLGRVENIEDRAAIEIAAARAGADEFIRGLPDGYDTALGTVFADGVELSGGQWQRIALARAFFRAAPLVVLDEPTAALDARAEYALYRGMRELFVGRTVLLISHRLASVREADHIYVLDQGRVRESGTHDELIDLGGLYAELYHLQDRTDHRRQLEGHGA